MNTKGKMSYKDFVFPTNPSKIKISHTRKISQQEIPLSNSLSFDMGKNCRVITGDGEFYGEDCVKSFDRLKAVFERDGGGILYIPSQKPIYALFSFLDFTADDKEGIIEYSFEFVESFENVSEEQKYEYIADGQSSLWDISYKFDKYIKDLIELNPSIRRPDTIIECGTRVTLC